MYHGEIFCNANAYTDSISIIFIYLATPKHKECIIQSVQPSKSINREVSTIYVTSIYDNNFVWFPADKVRYVILINKFAALFFFFILYIYSRSPLIDWYLLEKSIPYAKKAPARDCGHPFGQIPFLTDDTAEGRAEIFESGYLNKSALLKEIRH